MTDRSSRAGQLADALERRGAKITVRRLSTLTGPVPSVNPPTINTPLIDGAVLAGATAISLRCTAAQGRFVAGDVILAGDQVLTVTAQAVSRPTVGVGVGFTAIPVSPTTAPIADGTPATFRFGADLDTFAQINSYPVRLIDGERIRSRDLAVKLSAFALPDMLPAWRLIFGGRELSIVDAVPAFERGDIVSWDVQAR